MQHKINNGLKVILMASLLASISACESDSDGDDGSNDNSTFDLVDYLFPSVATNQDIMVELIEVSYHLELDGTWSSSEWGSMYTTYTKNSDGSIEIIDDYGSTSFGFTDNHMNISDEYGSETFERHVSVGDVVQSSEYSNGSFESIGQCVVDYHNSLSFSDVLSALPNKSYNDVIEIKCTYEYTEWTNDTRTEISWSGIDVSYSYYAQGEGEILHFDTDCLNDSWEIDDSLVQNGNYQQCDEVNIYTDIKQ